MNRAPFDNHGGLPPEIGPRQVWHLAWPVIISMLSFTATSLVDSIFVSRLGDDELGAIGLATLLTFLVISFAFGMLEGAKVAIAQRTGAEDHDSARRFGWQAVWIAGALGALTLLVIPLGAPLLTLMGADAAQTGLATDFLVPRLAGVTPMYLVLALQAYLQGTGDMRTPMVAALIGNAVNLALDPLLIFGHGPFPRLEMAGAAIATDIADAVQLLYLWHATRARLGGVSRRPVRDLLLRVWRLGAPLGLRGFMEVSAFAVFSGMLVHVGKAELAAHVLVVRILRFSFLPGHAIGQAASVLAGQAIGANRPDAVLAAFRSACFLALGVMGSCGLALVLLSDPLIGLFSPTEEVARTAVELMLIAAAFQLFDAVAVVGIGVLNGVGDTRFVMIFGVATSWVVKLPVAWALAFPAGLGAAGAWLGLTAEIVVVAGIMAWRVFQQGWRAPTPTSAAAEEGPHGLPSGA